MDNASKIFIDPRPAATKRNHTTTSEHVKAQRRRPRSTTLLAAIERVDLATDPATHLELINWIAQNYVDEGRGELLGLFAKCYLGHPYVDHQLSLGHQILEHFTPDDAVPPAFGPARSLVRSPAYIFVEVYVDGSVIPVRANGDPVN